MGNTYKLSFYAKSKIIYSVEIFNNDVNDAIVLHYKIQDWLRPPYYSDFSYTLLNEKYDVYFYIIDKKPKILFKNLDRSKLTDDEKKGVKKTIKDNIKRYKELNKID